jgi:hypothetical protein
MMTWIIVGIMWTQAGGVVISPAFDNGKRYASFEECIADIPRVAKLTYSSLECQRQDDLKKGTDR